LGKREERLGQKQEAFSFKEKMKFILLANGLAAGPLAYGICQSGCNAVVVACYAGAGFTFGTVTAGTGIPVAIAGCNAGLG
jgi:hypothetical protein